MVINRDIAKEVTLIGDRHKDVKYQMILEEQNYTTMRPNYISIWMPKPPQIWGKQMLMTCGIAEMLIMAGGNQNCQNTCKTALLSKLNTVSAYSPVFTELKCKWVESLFV